MNETSNSIVNFSTETEDNFKVEFEVFPILNLNDCNNERQKEIYKQITNIDEQSKILEEELSKYDAEIDRLTNKGDGLDWIASVASGIICGVIDSFVVGEFKFDEVKKNVDHKVATFVEQKGQDVRVQETLEKNIANAKQKAHDKGIPFTKEDEQNLIDKIKQGVESKHNDVIAQDIENGTSNALVRSIKKLEDHFKLPSDDIWKGTTKGINPMTHHLDDMAHHFSPLGLVAAIIGQLFRVGIFVNKDGRFFLRLASADKKKMVEMWVPIIISGLLLWLVYMAKKQNKEGIDAKVPKVFQKLITVLAATPAIISILQIASDWLGHLASDVAGSNSSASRGNLGMGIPGLFLSLLKELSSIPPLNLTGLPGVIDSLFVKYKFDMRAEIALFHELGRQSIPVIINEVLVRSFYFVRHLVKEYKENNGWNGINWNQVVPFKNRTVIRMLTIATGTFCTFDMIDAAIRSAMKNGTPQNPMFWKDLILRINFVGIGRFVIAIGTDIGMGIKRQTLIKKRLLTNDVLMNYQISKVYYLQENMWIEMEDAQDAMNKLFKIAEESTCKFNDAWLEIESSLHDIQKIDLNQMKNKNPGLLEDLLNTMEWS